MANEEIEEVQDRELTTPLLTLPEFKAHIAEEDLANIDSRDKRLLLYVSKIAQKVDWLADNMIQENRYIRELEREVIKFRKWKQRIMIRYSAYSAAIIFIITLFGGTIGEIVKAVFSVFSKHP